MYLSNYLSNYLSIYLSIYSIFPSVEQVELFSEQLKNTKVSPIDIEEIDRDKNRYRDRDSDRDKNTIATDIEEIEEEKK